MVTIPSLDSDAILRHVVVSDCDSRLLTWLISEPVGYGKAQLGFAFYKKGETIPLFSGDDFWSSSMHAYDSDQSLRSLLTFITLRKGDTDSDYFESYTEEQLEFSQSSECEQLQCELDEIQFQDVEIDVYELETPIVHEVSHETCNGHTMELSRAIRVF